MARSRPVEKYIADFAVPVRKLYMHHPPPTHSVAHRIPASGFCLRGFADDNFLYLLPFVRLRHKSCPACIQNHQTVGLMSGSGNVFGMREGYVSVQPALANGDSLTLL